MAPLLSVLETTGTHKQSLLRNATWTLSNFCRGKPAPDLQLIAPALPTMARLVLCQDSEVLSDVCWAMSYVSDGDEQRIDALLRNVPIEYLVQLISSREDLVQTPALRTIGNIVTGNDEQTDRVIRAGALPLLRQMLFHHKKSLRKEACWSLSNVTAGTPAQVAAVIACDIIPPVVNLLSVRYNFVTVASHLLTLTRLLSSRSTTLRCKRRQRGASATPRALPTPPTSNTWSSATACAPW